MAEDEESGGKRGDRTVTDGVDAPPAASMCQGGRAETPHEEERP